MTDMRCPAPIGFADVVDYWAGELTQFRRGPDRRARVQLRRLRAGARRGRSAGPWVAAVTREGRLHTVVTDAILNRLAADGVRVRMYIAVAAVLLYHGGQSWAIGGFLGVDTFFVLSGFLITSLLVTEWAGRGRIDLKAFWVRRARRLLPALFLVMVGIVVYAGVFAAPAELDRIRADSFAALGYVANWRFVFSGQSYFDQFSQPSPLRHMWSLAIEEQFYLVWPLVVCFLLWWRRSLRVLLVACLRADRGVGRPDGGALRARARPVARLLRHRHARAVVADRRGGRDPRVPARPDPVAAGTPRWCGSPPWSARATRSGCSGGCRSAPTRSTRVGSCSRRWRCRRSSCRWCSPTGASSGARLSFAPLRWVGRISYGLYLWHWPVYLTLTETRTGLDGVALLACPARGELRVRDRVVLRARAAHPPRHLPSPEAEGRRPGGRGRAGRGGVRHHHRRRRLDRGEDHARAPCRSRGAAGRAAAAAHERRRRSRADQGAARGRLGRGHAGPRVPEPSALEHNLWLWNRGRLGCGLFYGGSVYEGGELLPVDPECDWHTAWPEQIDYFKPDIALCSWARGTSSTVRSTARR